MPSSGNKFSSAATGYLDAIRAGKAITRRRYSLKLKARWGSAAIACGLALACGAGVAFDAPASCFSSLSVGDGWSCLFQGCRVVRKAATRFAYRKPQATAEPIEQAASASGAPQALSPSVWKSLPRISGACVHKDAI